MSGRRLIALAATIAVSAGAGWVARGPADPVPAPTRVALIDRAPVCSAPGDGAGHPLIAVSGDGRVTLRVEQQPLDWVLEQIALQSGRADLRGAKPSAPAAVAAVAATPVSAEGDATEALACPPTFLPVEPARLLHTIEHGADDDRIRALLRARADGLPVPEAVLRTLIESAVSERARLVALDSWLELRAGDPVAERAALEASLLVPNAAVQREARQRLDDLDETERLDALAAPGTP